jgi:hypothetical protein
VQISRIRLSDKTSRLRPRHVVPKPSQTYEPEVPVEVREWISPDYGSRGNAFNGKVKGVQLAIAEAAENSDHLVSPDDAIRIAMARQ